MSNLDEARVDRPPRDSHARHRAPVSPWMGYLIGPVFFAVGAWFYWGPSGLSLPSYKAMAIDPSRLSTAPRRKILHDPPVININGFDRTCMDCHRTFPAQDDPPRQLLQHKHIVLDHGINDRCRNCHYAGDRDRLVLHGGRVIGYEQVVDLCAKCHGPTFRDWENGAHGRTNGFWDRSEGPMQRLKCTECHDPHRPRVPAMDPIRPLPGPRTHVAPRPHDSHVGSENLRNPLHRRDRGPLRHPGKDSSK